MEKKWIVPVMTGLMALSLVGCSNGQRDSLSDTMTQSADPAPSGLSASVSPSGADRYHARTSTSTGERMIDDARYYASSDGELPTCDGDMAQKGCEMRRQGRTLKEDADVVTDDVERAMRDVGKTMDQVITSDM